MKIPYAAGTYTETAPHVPDARGGGVSILSFDDDTGMLETVQTLTGMMNPTYLYWNRLDEVLAAIEEDPDSNGAVSLFSKNGEEFFERFQRLPGPGAAGCHISGNSPGNILYGAAYGSGSLGRYEKDHRGEFRLAGRTVYSGDGPDLSRQEGPHAHQVFFNPQEDRIYVCDLGADLVRMHRTADRPGPGETALKVPGGYGPRHLAMDNAGEYAFILCELKPRLLLAEIDGKTGKMEILQDYSVVDEDYTGPAAPAAIKIHPSGKTLALSVRFADRIEVFSLIRRDGAVELEWINGFSSLGMTPRDIDFCPSGRWLLAANQDSHDIRIFGFNGESGLPEPDRTSSFGIYSPVCLVPLS